MAGIDGLDVMERTGPYRDPRAAFGRKPGSPVGIGQFGQPASPPPRIPVGQATNIGTAPVSATNPAGVTPKPLTLTADPRTAYGRAGAAAPGIPGMGVRTMAPGFVPPEFAGTPAAQSIAGPAPVAGAVQGAATGIGEGAAPAASRFAQVRAGLNGAIPSPTLQVPGVVKTAGTLAGKVAGPAALAYEGYQTGRDVLTPGMTGIDQAARVAEGIGRGAGATAGGMAGAAAGTALLPGIGTAVGGILGGAAGYFAPDLANKAYNLVTGGDNQLASDKAAELRAKQVAPAGIAAPPPIPAGSSTAGAGRGFVNPPLVQPDPPAPAPDNSLDITRGMPNASAISPSLEAELSAARMAAAGRGEDRPAGISGIADSATEERNARLARQNPLDKLESAARLATSGRERATALSAYGQLAGSQDQGTTQRDIADIRDLGETKRNVATNATNLTREKLGNATTMRGQDITSNSQAATNKASIGIAQIGADARKSASEMAADARLAAAEATAKRYIPVAGGQQVKDINGLPQVVTSPASVFDATTGKYVEAQPAGAGNIGAPQATPRADYDKMPKGTRYVGPDGKTYTKG